MRVLVAEKIGASGVALLREHFDVDEGDHLDRIEEYDGILIRSATKVTADVIDRATRLKAIGRAGVGVDNVDVPAATKRGIVVANAPQSNVVTAAEHTMALLLALARNVPQAHAQPHRRQVGALAVLGRRAARQDARDPRLRAHRPARGPSRPGLRDARHRLRPFVGAERYRDLGVEKAESSDDVYAQADFLTLHLPKTPETEGWLDAEALAKCKDGVRVLNVARGPLIVDEDLEAALDSGKVGGAALDVFRTEPITEHPLFGRPNVIVTPHLGASTAEATDRAGFQAAEQVVAALTGGVVSSAVNVPAVAAEDMEVLGPFLPLSRQLGRLAMALGEGSSVDRVDVELLGRIAERDTRPLAVEVLLGVLTGHTEEDVNAVNAPALAEERGIVLTETRGTQARDFADLVRVSLVSGDQRVRVVGTTLGRRHRPHLLEAWGHRFNLQLEDHIALFRYRDVPGMIGRVGTCFGENGINISSAAVGHVPEDGDEDLAVMIVTTDEAVPDRVVEQIVGLDGFVAGRAVALG